MNRIAIATGCLCLVLSVPAAADDVDAEGCKDHPLFSRMPNFWIASCDSNQFDVKRFPTGPANLKDEDGQPTPKHVDLEGPYTLYRYSLKDEATRPSEIQLMRNFENATRKARGEVLGTYPGWCKATLDRSLAPGNNCINHGVAMKFARDGKEVWAFMQTGSDGAEYELHLLERQAMTQDIVATDLFDKLQKEGFVALYLNFDTGKATLQADSLSQVDQIAAMLKANSALKLEVAGHTDNVGNEKSNLKLSDDRAKTVVKALLDRGIVASRLTAKGYGQSSPVADNRTEEGRAKNRRVELVKK